MEVFNIFKAGKSGPNFDSTHVRACGEALTKANLKPSVMIDCSHGNSAKQHKRQIVVAQDLVNQMSIESSESLISSGEFITGVMIESHLVEGRQDLPDDKSKLVYGQSVTDACISWQDTVEVLNNLAKGVRARRAFKVKK